MKKLLSILVLSLLLSGNAYAKVKTVEKNENYIILKYSSLLKLKENKQRKLLYETMMIAADHCNSVGKNAYWFLGFAHGDGNVKRGSYIIDMEVVENLKKYNHRIVCSKDLQIGLKLFKNRVANYNSELNLNIRPREYLINTIENRKKIPSLKEENKKKAEKKKKEEKDPQRKTKPLGLPKENAERAAALKFYKIECGKLSYDGNVMLNKLERYMDKAVYRITQRKLSDAVLYEGIDRTCNMLYGVLNPQGLIK